MNLNNAEKAIQDRETIDRAIMRVNTCIPGKIISFDSDTQTATVQPAIQMRTFVDDTEKFENFPEIINAPIIFPFVSVAGFALTFAVSANDPCLILFSQRAIDNWHERGGVQPPEDGTGSRHHDLTDAFILFAPSPLPEVLDDWEDSGIELRNREKDSRVTLRDEEVEIQVNNTIIQVNSDGTINITAPDNIAITSPAVTMSGTLTVTGKIESETAIYDPNGTMQEMRNIYNSHQHDGGAIPDQLME